MTVSRKYITLLTTLVFIALGIIIAYLTDWWLFVPVLFALGIPITNIQGNVKQKIAQIFVICIVSVALFFGATLAMLTPGMDLYLFPGFISGIAGVGFLGINGLLIEMIKLDYRSITLTFLLSACSFPLWVFMTGHFLPDGLTDDPDIKFAGAVILWMITTTIGISTGIKNKKPTANNGYKT